MKIATFADIAGEFLVYGSVDNPEFGLLKLTPWRLEVTSVATVPPERKIWYASGIAG